MHYRINGGRTCARRSCASGDGGERYGDENDHYFAEYRGTVTGQRPGDRVEVWFSGSKPRRGLRHQRALHLPRPRRPGRAACSCWPTRTTRGVNPTYPAGTQRPALRRAVRRRAPGQRDPLGGLGRRQGRRAARPRRARPLRRGRLVPRRQPAHPGRRRRAGGIGDRPAPGLPGRRPRQGPRAQRALLPQRGRQADPRRRDHELLRPAARRQRRRHLLRPEGPSGAAVLHLDQLPRRLRAAVGRLHAVLPRRATTAPTWARRPAFVGDGRSVRGSRRGPGGHADQPAGRGGRLRGDQHGAAARRVPAVPEPEGRATTSAPSGRSSPSRASGTSPAATRTPVPAAHAHDRPDRGHRGAGADAPGAAELQHRGRATTT